MSLFYWLHFCGVVTSNDDRSNICSRRRALGEWEGGGSSGALLRLCFVKIMMAHAQPKQRHQLWNVI